MIVARLPARHATWFFDLDNTLHDASRHIFPTLNTTMNAYIVKHLGVSEAEAGKLRRDYWLRYGSTLRGLVENHQVRVQHFLDETHQFIHETGSHDLIHGYPGLVRLLARLPGRKVLLTNAPARYAHKVLQILEIDRHFARRYAIEQMNVNGYLRPKPSRAMLRMLLARERCHPANAILVEDSPENLRSARAIGMKTVLVTQSVAPIGRIRKSRPPYVDLQVKSVRQLLNRQRLLR